MAPGGGDVREHGVLVALVLAVVDEEVEEGAGEEVEERADGELDDGADEEVDEEVEVDVVLSMVLEEVALKVDGVIDISAVVEVALLMQEHPLNILDGKPEHAVTHAGSVAEVVAAVYVEQNEAAAAEDRIIARYARC